MSAFAVGQESFLMVGIGGKVTGLGDDWVEIEGYRLPTTLGAGPSVRYVSLNLPNDHDGNCNENAEYARQLEDELERVETRWSTLIQETHRDKHTETWVFCPDPLCAAVKRELGVIGAVA